MFKPKAGFVNFLHHLPLPLQPIDGGRAVARGGALGTGRVRAAAGHVQAQGGDVLALETLESNVEALRLYDRLGFRTVERVLAAPVSGLVADAHDGPTFGAVHVQTDDVEKVRRDAVKVLRLEPEIEVGTGWVRVRSDVTDADPAKLKALAKELSYTTGVVVLSLGVERGAVVRYDLFDRGADVDEYLSVPEYYGPLPPGDAYALGANPTVVPRLTGAAPEDVHAEWCLAEEDRYEEILGSLPRPTFNEEDPLAARPRLRRPGLEGPPLGTRDPRAPHDRRREGEDARRARGEGDRRRRNEASGLRDRGVRRQRREADRRRGWARPFHEPSGSLSLRGVRYPGRILPDSRKAPETAFGACRQP